MTRPASPASAASSSRRIGTLALGVGAALTLTAVLGSAGCQVAPLPEGSSWSGKPVSDVAYTPRRSGSFRGGFDASRIDRTTAATNRGGKAYSFASLLGDNRSRSASGPAESPADLSPPAAAPQDLYAGADDPAQQLFGSPAAAPRGYAVELAPTPVAGRNAGVATHTVQRGDNLWRIAERTYGNGLRYQDILRANPGINPQKLTPGDRLVLPGVTP